MKSIREYHEAAKHSWEKLYQDNHTLDWSNQPDPFRAYLDCSRIALGSSFEKMGGNLSSVWSHQNITPRSEPIILSTISTLLYYSMAISAWKSYRGIEPWSLRVNPSSGDLHPTETHIYTHNIVGIPNGAYHYFAKDHLLEQRAVGDIAPSLWKMLGGASPAPPVIIGLNTIFWREAWKYQSRALRYCYLDLGHAMAAIKVAARGLGLSVTFIGGFSDDALRQFLCFDKTDEYPLLFVAVDIQQPVVDTNLKEIQKGDIHASIRINRLSGEIVENPLIDTGHALTSNNYDIDTSRRYSSPVNQPCKEDGQVIPVNTGTPAHEYPLKWTIRHRRSAVDFDGKTTMPNSTFLFLMRLLCASPHADYLSSCDLPLIIPFLYVHRVEGIERGVYRLERVTGCLFFQSRGDVRTVAKVLSLNQDIAGDSAFAVSFISNFDYALQKYGNRGYRYIHFEAGFLGHALYLGATAMGYDGTGIGAFIDDEVHTFLKTPASQQVVYHFTVGKRADDPRISTLPSYAKVHDDEEDART